MGTRLLNASYDTLDIRLNTWRLTGSVYHMRSAGVNAPSGYA